MSDSTPILRDSGTVGGEKYKANKWSLYIPLKQRAAEIHGIHKGDLVEYQINRVIHPQEEES